MRRILAYIVLPLVVAAASIVSLVTFWLNDLLRPSWPAPTVASFYVAAAAILIFTALAFAVMRLRSRAGALALALSVVLIAAAGLAPRMVDFYVTSAEQQARQSEGADVEMEFQNAYLDRSDDVDERIAAKNPYTPEEALAFLEFAANADFTWRSLPDHTPSTFALVEQAIDGGILDPNSLTTTAPTADSPALTITLAFYDKRIRPASPRAIARHDWDVLQILVAKGADVSAPDAAGLRADLAKTVVLGKGRFLELK